MVNSRLYRQNSCGAGTKKNEAHGCTLIETESKVLALHQNIMGAPARNESIGSEMSCKLAPMIRASAMAEIQ